KGTPKPAAPWTGGGGAGDGAAACAPAATEPTGTWARVSPADSPGPAPAPAGTSACPSPKSSSRLSTTPLARATRATALTAIATQASSSLLVAMPPISTRMAPATNAARNRITCHLLVSGCAGEQPSARLATVRPEAADVLGNRVLSRRGRRARP